MSVLNPLAKEISAKIVYYGPGMSGKTTSLQFIHASLKPAHRGELVSLETEGDRTLFFDFLPVHIEKVRGLDVRLQLYTVPGQVFYGATRQLVLDGADGVIFVADSQIDARDRNVESLNDLEANLKKQGTSLKQVPHVIQYNKRDLKDILSVADLRRDLNLYEAPDFETSAAAGRGVVDALKEVVNLVKKALAQQAERPARRADTSRRQSFDAEAAMQKSKLPDTMAAQVKSALSSRRPLLAEDPRRATEPSRYEGIPIAEVTQSDSVSEGAMPEVAVLGTPLPGDGKTIQAPAASPMSFATLWRDGDLVLSIERSIAIGHFAEAVNRAARGVSEILEGLLGPHDPEGSGTRAQLLGLDGREYLELRRLASRPAASITQNEALFAFYVLVAARVKQARLVRY